MSFVSFMRLAGLIVWGLVLTGTLSIAQWPGDWGHSVCGAWGCGPPLQALVACHSSWLVILLPMTVIAVQRVSERTLQLSAVIVLSFALVVLLGVAIHEYLTWYERASAWQRPFFWRRVGFVILTTVEVPMLQTLALSLLVLSATTRRHQFRSAVNSLIEVPRPHAPEPDDSPESSPAIR